MRTIPIVATVLLLAGCGNIGGGETVVHGDDNVVVADQAIDLLASALASFEATPEVTDAEIGAVYAKVREDALTGELDAALVMLKLAVIQRTPEE